MSLTLPTIFTVLAALAFFTLERLAPGRELPNWRGWYSRAILINLAQIGITLGPTATRTRSCRNAAFRATTSASSPAC